MRTTKRGVTEISYGTSRLTEFRVAQKEILDDIAEKAPQLRFPEVKEDPVPEVVVKRRGVSQKLPKEFEDVDVLQGSDEVFYRQIARGNQTRRLRKIFQLPLRSPYYMAKNGLVLHGVVEPNDPVFKRLRSVLATDWIGTERKGWMELRTYGTPLQRTLCGDKWWQDLAIPHPWSAKFDSTVVRGQVYVLDKRGDLVSL